MLGNTNAVISQGGSEGSQTYEADLVLKGVVDGLPQPTEEDVVNTASSILYNVINGTVSSITQIVIPTISRESPSYWYSILAHYSNNKTLPIVYDGENITVFDEVETDENVNCIVQKSNNDWVLVRAYDGAETMIYGNVREIGYLNAINWNWDDGHLVDGHPSVNTSRFSLSGGVITDTYTGNVIIGG